MSLPGSKAPLPGYRLIVDSSGNYIDDVPNLRLGPEFVLSRNTADPSANISVAAAIAAGAAAAVPNSGTASGRFGLPVLIGPVQTLAAAASYTSVSFVAETYKELILKVDATDVGGGTTFGNMTLTGLTGTGNGYLTTNAGATNNIGVAATIFIFSGGSSADIHVETNIFPLNTGRRRKFQSKGISIGSTATWYCHGGGDFPDTTHGVTAVSFSTTALTGTVELWGIPV